MNKEVKRAREEAARLLQDLVNDRGPVDEEEALAVVDAVCIAIMKVIEHTLTTAPHERHEEREERRLPH